MLTTPEASTNSAMRKLDHRVLVLEPVMPLNGLDPIMLLPGRYVIGSSSQCDVVLPVPGVEPLHCLVIAGTNKTILKAWNSQTLLNDRPVQEAVLTAEDRLTIGSIEFHVKKFAAEQISDRTDQTGGQLDSSSQAQEADSASAQSDSSYPSQSLSGSQRLSRAMSRAIESGSVLKTAKYHSKPLSPNINPLNHEHIVDKIDQLQEQLAELTSEDESDKNSLKQEWEAWKSQEQELAEESAQREERRKELTAKESQLESDRKQFDELRNKHEEQQQSLLNETQKEIEEKQKQVEEQQLRLAQERDSFEEERRQFEESQISGTEEREGFDNKQEQLDEERQKLLSEIDADRRKIDSEREQLEAGEAELLEAITAFKVKREDFKRQQEQLQTDLETLDDNLTAQEKERRANEAARKELSQQEQELDTERKRTSDEAESLRREREEFEALRAEKEEERQSVSQASVDENTSEDDSALQNILNIITANHQDNLSDGNDESLHELQQTGEIDQTLSVVLSGSVSDADSVDVEPGSESQSLESEPADEALETTTTDSEDEVCELDDAEDPRSVSKYMKDLLNRTRENQTSDQPGVVPAEEIVVEPALPKEVPDNGSVSPDNHAEDSNSKSVNEEQLDIEDVQPASDPDFPVAPLSPQVKEAARSDLDSLREVANISARSAIARHSSKKIRETIFLKILLAVLASSITFGLLHGKLIMLQGEDLQTFVLAAAAVSVLTILELIRAALKSLVNDVKTLHTHRRSAAIRESEANAEDDL